MSIEEYRKQFIDELRFNAEHEGTEPETQFLIKSIEDLESMGELNDPNLMPGVERRGRRGRIMAFDAYAYDEADCALVMIASDFYNERDVAHTLTRTRIDELFNHMLNFIDESVNGHMSEYFDDSEPELCIAREFSKKIGKSLLTAEITRFKFLIISNAVLSNQVKNLKREDFLGRPVELNVWTLERFYQTYISNKSEIVEFETSDFDCAGIQCVKANLGEKNEHDSYLCIVPGKFLADIYLRYGSKLLQGNVRAFLSVRGKVNKGIRTTIVNEPQNFFTYNNGIAVVARSVRFSKDGSKIVYFCDPQIINGGQTTASLANAAIKKEARNGWDSLFVPMKLTVLNVENEMSEQQLEEYNDITRKISECANSQNAVSSGDFFSNHPFHKKMEELSRKVMAPPVGGNPYQTIWFYERSRGKWEQEQMQMSVSEKKKFCEQYPKNQVIKKERLAKCLNTIYMNPQQVCQSSAINFTRFADTIEQLWDASKDNINDVYFKKAVCSVIIFDSLDSMIGKSGWYPKGGNKAQITPYAIAKLMTLIPKGYDIDWKTIWQKQSLYRALAEELMKLAYIAHNFLLEQAQGGIVRTISRTLKVWENFKNLNYQLSEDFIESLVSASDSKAEEQAAKRAHKFNSQIDASLEIFNLGQKYWMRVYNDLNKENVLSYGDVSFIKGVAEYIGRNKLPTDSQCRRLMKIIIKVEDMGYVMP